MPASPPFYIPFYVAVQDGLEFDAPPSNDEESPPGLTGIPHDVVLVASPSSPFAPELRVIRGAVRGADGPVANVEIARGNVDRVLTNQRGDYALPLRLPPLSGADHHRRHGPPHRARRPRHRDPAGRARSRPAHRHQLKEIRMPQYLSSGVYVEEIDAGPKPIEGVSTSICGAVGVTVRGSSDGKPVPVTSFAEFTRIFGGFFNPRQVSDQIMTVGMDNWSQTGGGAWWQFPLTVKAFFDNGGRTLYVKRVFARDRTAQGGRRPLPSP